MAESSALSRQSVSDLRIALLGTSMSENSRVGNLILGKGVFGKKTPSTDEEHSGRVGDRNITVISTDLLKTKLKLEAATQKAFELSRFNPDVIILVLQHNEFRQFHKDRLPSVLIYFGEQAKNRTMILTTDDEKDSSTQQSVKENKRIQQLSAECGGGRLQLLNTLRSDIFRKVDEVITHNGHETQLDKEDYDDADDLRIVVMGKTGVGKSASANTILRREAFKSVLNSQSVTKECQKETAEFSRRCITVIDTPGLFDTGVDNHETMKEVVKCVSMAAPGPHVFLLVISLGRFTKEEKDAVKIIQERFGDQSSMYTMVLFTRGVDLKGTSIEDFIEGNRSLENLLHQCGNRYHVFNNDETNDKTQVSELLEKIDRMVAENGGSFYTNEMFQLVEKNIREEQKRILMENEDEINRKKEDIRDKYEAEKEQMKKETERKRQEMQDELRKRKEEFEKEEEEIKKEKDERLQKKLQKKQEEQQKHFEEKMKRMEKALEEQQKNLIKCLEEQHDKEKQKLKEEIKRETRKQAEREYRKRIDSIPYRSKRASDWSYYVPVIGGAAGSIVGSAEDLFHWIYGLISKTKYSK